MRDLTRVRKEYQLSELILQSADADPFLLFSTWYEEIEKMATVSEPNAMVLSTVSEAGRPSSRVLLLKGFSHEGFLFFTNYSSRKGNELAVNPHAALLFYWPELERQVRIEGAVNKTDDSISSEYFEARPIGSQVSAIVSPQSSVIKREDLERAHRDLLQQASQNQTLLRRPDNWGGYCLVPEAFEFWQGRSNRLHDRIAYRRHLDAWVKESLAP
jgi:pyridoxamine 5'-phosphate oxidase